MNIIFVVFRDSLYGLITKVDDVYEKRRAVATHVAVADCRLHIVRVRF